MTMTKIREGHQRPHQDWSAIQRSKGYQTRPTLSVEQIGELIAFVKAIKPDVICMVDNCYGEFVEAHRALRRGRGYGRRLPDQESRRRAGSDRRLYRRNKGSASRMQPAV